MKDAGNGVHDVDNDGNEDTGDLGCLNFGAVEDRDDLAENENDIVNEHNNNLEHVLDQHNHFLDVHIGLNGGICQILLDD